RGAQDMPRAPEVVQDRLGEGLLELRRPLDRRLQLVVAAVEGDHGRLLAPRADRAELFERLAEDLSTGKSVSEQAVVDLLQSWLVAGGLLADRRGHRADLQLAQLLAEGALESL